MGDIQKHIKIALFDAKAYDKIWFDEYKSKYNIDILYIENKLTSGTAGLANGCNGVIAFVNDIIDEAVINTLVSIGIEIVAMRCAGYNNVDLCYASGKLIIVTVPAYSPNSVAEYAIALLFTLNRKIHRAYMRTKEFDFSINGLLGFEMCNKTVGVVGTGRIGRAFINICRGIGMNVIAFDPNHSESDIKYVSFDELCANSDIISLHCPLTKETYHIINKDSFTQMKDGIVIINTSRGALIDAEELITAIKTHKVGGAALDVYEEERTLFYEDFSDTVIQDDVIARLLSMPNVIVTSHQAFLTKEALENIANTTLSNLSLFFKGVIQNEVKSK
ncbi:D-lactate dehydrogenase [bioreactor metagenome]|uniref:D-lactate dehydrogenase n=1 Tax=bioreactor metagenome TaxID=1076179 RepID=A0A645AXH3_9ZZZZ|nr:2-hydroxyacid dehydrogenase [Oscillospiraceae bacterium]